MSLLGWWPWLGAQLGLLLASQAALTQQTLCYQPGLHTLCSLKHVLGRKLGFVKGVKYPRQHVSSQAHSCRLTLLAAVPPITPGRRQVRRLLPSKGPSGPPGLEGLAMSRSD